METIRHSLSHILALAVKRLYGNKVKFGTGPATEYGFFYDFEFAKPLPASALSKIQKEMEKIIRENIPFQKKSVFWNDSRKYFKKAGQPYKLELLDNVGTEQCSVPTKNIRRGSRVTHYILGEFEDLCKGPHVKNTGALKNIGFRLEKIAGAYWQADEKNKMLTRITGLAFASKKELAEFLKTREEAKERDHKKSAKKWICLVFTKKRPVFRIGTLKAW